MSRELDSTLASHLTDKVLYPVILAQITFRSQTEYVWTGVGPMAFNGQTYKGVGSAGSIGAITESSSIEAAGTSIMLSGIDPALRGESLTDIWQGAPAKLWFGLWNNGALVGTPYLIFSGQVDKPSLTIGAEADTISLALESRMINMQRASNRRYTAADQALEYPLDTGFVWMEILNDLALNWGG